MYLQINTVKYDADWEITNIYENLQIVLSQFFTNMLLFVYIRSTSNIYWFISILIRCQQIPKNSYSVTLTICTFRSAIWWAITKVILNYSCLPNNDIQHMALSIMILSIMTLCIMTLSLLTLCVMILNILTLSIKTQSVMTNNNDIKHHNAKHNDTKHDDTRHINTHL